MPAPIVVTPQQNPWQNLLFQYFMMRSMHKANLEERKVALEEKRADIESSRKWETKQAGLSESQNLLNAGYKPVSQPETQGVYPGENRATQNVYTGQIYSAPTPQPQQVEQGPGYIGVRDPRTGSLKIQATTQPAKPTKGSFVDILGKDGKSYKYAVTYNETGSPVISSKPVGLSGTQPKQPTTEENLSGLKLDTWKKYLGSGNLSAEEQRLIGVDKDPFLGQAVSLVKNDPKMWASPLEKQIEAVQKTAALLKGSQGGTQGGAQGYQYTAVNPKTKERLGWNGSQWVPIK